VVKNRKQVVNNLIVSFGILDRS